MSTPREPLSSSIALGLSQTPIAPIAPVARRAAAGPLPDAPWQRALVIADPDTGHGRGRSVADELRRGLRSLGVRVDVHLMRRPGDGRARLAALASDVDLIVAAGDADTFAEALSGWPGRGIAVACVPLEGRSERVLGPLRKRLGLARDVDGALETLVARHTLAFPFLRIGAEAVLARLHVEARDDASPLHVTIDGEQEREALRAITIERPPSRWGSWRRRPDRGLAFRWTRTAARGLGLGRWRSRREALGAVHLTIDAPRPAAVWIDGRARGTTPIELDVETTCELLVP